MTTTLRGMTWDHPRGYAGLEAASTAYEAQRGIRVVWDRRSLQSFADAAIADMAERYDLIVLDHPHVGVIAETACLAELPMPPDAGASSLGGSLESYVWNDRLWAYPVDAACQMAVRRPDLDTPELPDWEAALTARPADYRLVTPLLPVDAFDMMMTLVASRGERDLPHAPDLFVSERNGLLALEVIRALYRLGPAEAVDWNPIVVLEALATTDEFAASPCLFGYINYARPGFRPHALAYRDLPTFRGSAERRGILGGAGIGVSARSRHAGAAKAFAAWVVSEPIQSGVYLENDGQPAHRETWLRKGGDPRYASFLQGGLATMESAWTRPRDVWFLGFVDDVCAIFPDVVRGRLGTQDALDAINALYRTHRRPEEPT